MIFLAIVWRICRNGIGADVRCTKHFSCILDKKINYCELDRLFLLNVLAANEVIHVMHIRS